MSDEIDLAAVTTCTDFGRVLTVVRERAGLSVRDVARKVNVPASTVGGYFGGSHLPGLKPANLVENMLRACGVTDPAELRRWVETWSRIRRTRRGSGASERGASERGASERGAAEQGAAGGGWGPGAVASRRRGSGGPPRAPVDRVRGDENVAALTVAPPVARLDRLPAVRGRGEMITLLTGLLPTAVGDTAGSGPARPAGPGGSGGSGGSGEPVGPGRRGNGTRVRGRVHVLHGLGGIGKSTVALALAATALDRGVRTWWISATRPGAVPAAMGALAVELGATHHQLRRASLPDLVWRLLGALDQPWLLVVDNADDPADDLGPSTGNVLDGTGWLRPVTGTRGMVVVTTRDGAAWSLGSAGGRPPPWIRLHRLTPLTDRDAGRALLDLAGDGPGSAQAAQSLGRRLGGLPLALSLAGQFLAEARRMPPGFGGSVIPRTYPAYEQFLRTSGPWSLLPDFAAADPRSAAPRTRPQPPDTPADAHPPADVPERRRERELVGPTWELSLNLLALRGQVRAQPLLTLLACLGGDPIPVDVLLDAEVLTASPLFSDLPATELWGLVRALAGHGLIEYTLDPTSSADPTNPAAPADAPMPATATAPGDAGAAHRIWLHPLVRDSFGRAAHVSGRVEDYLETITALLVHAARRLDPRDPETWPAWTMLAGHADAGLAMLRARRQWGLPALTEGRLPPELLVPATLAARFLRATGRLTEAAAGYETVLDTGRRLFGDDHADVLSAAHDLYRVRAAQGRPGDAEEGLRAVLDDRARVLGADHPDTLTTQHYLGRTLRESGRHPEALAWLTRTLTSRERVLGHRHRDTLTTRNNVADLLVEQQQWTAAEHLLSAVWTDRVDTLGPEHPATLVTRYHLARLDHRRGEHARAAGTAAELVAVCRRVLGPDHPRTLAAIGLHGEIEQELGRLAALRADVADAYRRSLRVLGPEHGTTRRLQRLQRLVGRSPSS
ncbi:helix-turn-helix transcriptional regulator [Frankia sp. ArI3]|uniref:helix-turn-helix transcriptional regulator n=1 Tax=Frankia sp. ArI3 TaxID=1858 RepID=UPI001C6FC736|nr:helix-turn-helix transcriptional regulator [Frankia sp. ArI3]